MQNKQSIKPAASKADAVHFNPFAKREGSALNQGTVAIEESRAVAEAMGKLYLAKKFPRDEAVAYDKVILACGRKSMAEQAEYAYARGGATISGPSIRLAEEMIRAWGNCDYGIRELSDDEDSTEMEAYCWDLETNVISSQKFRVKKERKANGNTLKLTDQRDIYEQNANLGNRRLRARILAVLPPDLKEAALAQCKLTLQPPANELPNRVIKMIAEFKKLKVTSEMLEIKQNKKTPEFNADDFALLLSIYNSIKDGISTPADWFEGAASGKAAATDGAAGDLNKLVQGS